VAVDFSAPTDWMTLTPEEMAGIAHYRRERCAACHGGDRGVGPDLTGGTTRKDAAWMIAHFKHPSSLIPGSQMPAISLTDSQLNALAAFLLKLTPANAMKLQDVPDSILQGAMIYQKNRCSMCHEVNGVGQKTGPPLNGLSHRRKADWVMQHFLEPQKFSPGSTMPPYKLTAKENEVLTGYLMELP
jgi:mono/diheme cytochrome c family protein